MHISTVVVRQSFRYWKPSLYSSFLAFQGKSDEQLYLKGLINLGPATYGDVILCLFKCFVQSDSQRFKNASFILHHVQS